MCVCVCARSYLQLSLPSHLSPFCAFCLLPSVDASEQMQTLLCVHVSQIWHKKQLAASQQTRVRSGKVVSNVYNSKQLVALFDPYRALCLKDIQREEN